MSFLTSAEERRGGVFLTSAEEKSGKFGVEHT